jgi:ABC-type amino acid transport substrate-binding protein
MKLRFFVTTIVVMLVAGLLLSSVPSVHAQSAAPRGTVKVASNVSIPLRIYREGTEVKGYEYEVYKEALRRAGYEVEVVDVAFAGIFPGLQAEKWDMACSSIYITKERVKQMDFTDPFYEGFEAAVAKKDSSVKSLKDFKGKTFGAQTGTSQAAWLASLQKDYGPFQIRGYQEDETLFNDLETGRVDGLTTGFFSAVARLKNRPNFEVIATNPDSFMIGCAVRTGHKLREEFNRGLNEMKKDGTVSRIYERYFNAKPAEGSAVVRILAKPYEPQK